MTEATAFRQIPRPDPAGLEILRGIPAADLHDEMSPVDQRLQLMHHSMRPVLPGKRFFGPAVVVLPPAQVQRLAAAARARIERDERTQVAIANGATLFERLGGEEAMRKLGLDIVEGTWHDSGK